MSNHDANPSVPMKCARFLCAHPTYLPPASDRDWQTGICCVTSERCCSSRCCADCLVFSSVCVAPGVWGGAITDYALDSGCKWLCGGVVCSPCWPVLSICIPCTNAEDGALTTRETVRRKAGIDRQEMRCPNLGTGNDGTDCWSLTCCLPLWPACGTAQMWRELHHRGVKPYPECITRSAWCFCTYMCCASDLDHVRYTAAVAECVESNRMVEAQLGGEEIVVQVEDAAGNVSMVTLLNSFHLPYVLKQLPSRPLNGHEIGCPLNDVNLMFGEMPLQSGDLQEHGVETGATLRLHGAELTPGHFAMPAPAPVSAPSVADYPLPKGTGVCCSALWVPRCAQAAEPRLGRHSY